MTDVTIQTPDGPVDEVPLITDNYEKRRYIGYCFDIKQPAFLINMVGKREWCFVECDLLTVVEEGEEWGTGYTGISDPGAKQVNEICEDFTDVEQPSHYTGAIGSLSTREEATFISFPSMRPEDARRFADRLAPVFMDPENWRVTNPQEAP